MWLLAPAELCELVNRLFMLFDVSRISLMRKASPPARGAAVVGVLTGRTSRAWFALSGGFCSPLWQPDHQKAGLFHLLPRTSVVDEP